jgi:Flp pilus assembly protein TadD
MITCRSSSTTLAGIEELVVIDRDRVRGWRRALRWRVPEQVKAFAKYLEAEQFRIAGNAHGARHAYEQALEIFARSPSWETALVYLGMADLLCKRDPHEARKCTTRAREALSAAPRRLAEQVSRDVRKCWGHYHRVLGSLNFETGSLSDAATNFKDLLSYYSPPNEGTEQVRQKIEVGLANTEICLGQIAVRALDLNAAAKYYGSAGARYAKAGDPSGRGNSAGAMGELAVVRGSLEDARRDYETALKWLVDSDEALAWIYGRLGELACLRGEHADATAAFDEANKRSDANAADIALGRARVELVLGRPNLARQRLADAHDTYAKVGNVIGQVDALTLKAEIHLFEVLSSPDVPDVRSRTPEEIARLILDRLRLVNEASDVEGAERTPTGA